MKYKSKIQRTKIIQAATWYEDSGVDDDTICPYCSKLILETKIDTDSCLVIEIDHWPKAITIGDISEQEHKWAIALFFHEKCAEEILANALGFYKVPLVEEEYEDSECTCNNCKVM